MITPPFWYHQTPTRVAEWLRPLSRIYLAVRTAHVKSTRPRPSSIPTICIGGITAGGAGKTPVVHALARLLSAYNPTILTRGHGGTLHGPIFTTAEHTAIEIGDEAMLHTRIAPTVIARNRFEGATLIEQNGGRLIIMDDGLQNRTISAQINFVVIDGRTGLGNGLCLPAGPLREKPDDVWPRTSAIIMIGDDQTNLGKIVSAHTPIIQARLNYDTTGISPAARHIAFAGLGLPQKFFNTLNALGINVIGTAPFPDHHQYTQHNIDILIAWAKRERAYLITTAKDAVKLPPELLQKKILKILPQTLTFEQPETVLSILAPYISDITSTPCPAPSP